MFNSERCTLLCETETDTLIRGTTSLLQLANQETVGSSLSWYKGSLFSVSSMTKDSCVKNVLGIVAEF